jgi:hypothetical protein
VNADRDARREGRRLLAWELLGGALAIGLFVGVAGPLLVDWITEGVQERGLEGFWGPIFVVSLVSLAIAAILVLVTVSLIRATGRQRWARFGKWLWSWRPVSYRRHRREMTQQNEAMLAEVGGVAGGVSENEAATDKVAKWAYDAIEKVRLSIPDVTLELLKQIHESKKAIEELRTDVDRLAKPKTGAIGINMKSNVREEVRGAAESDTAQPTVIPSPLPRWRLVHPDRREDDNADDGKYLLRNLIEGSVAKNVRIENGGMGYFDFEDGAFWSDFSGVKSGAFGGTIVTADGNGDIWLKLTYLDSLGKSRYVIYLVNKNGRVREMTDQELSIRI